MPETLIDGLQPLTAAALEASPRVITARFEMLAAEAHEEELRSLTRPRADFYLDGAYRENNATRMGSFETYYSLVAEQPLWHWNSLDNQKKIAKIQRQLAEKDYDEARRSLVLDIRQRYVDLVLKKRELAETEAAYNRQSRHLAVSREQAGRGELPADLLAGERLDLRTTEVARDRKRADFQRSLREFALMNGLSSFTGDTLPAKIPGVPVEALSLFRSLEPVSPVSNRVPVALAKDDGLLAQARLNEQVIRVRDLPMFNLAAGADQDQTSGADQTAVISYFAGVRVRWNIFDGFATRAATREARAQVRGKEKALELARTGMFQQLADAATDIELASKGLQIAEERFDLTQAHQRVDRDLWQSGRLSETEWQLVQSTAEGEDTALMQLRGQLILQLAEYELMRQRATKSSQEISFP